MKLKFIRTYQTRPKDHRMLYLDQPFRNQKAIFNFNKIIYFYLAIFSKIL